MRVYKYEIEINKLDADDCIEIEMHPGLILSAGTQHSGTICIWALQLTATPKIKRKIMIKGTGHEINAGNDYDFIGTVIFADIGVVLHVFEVSCGV